MGSNSRVFYSSDVVTPALFSGLCNTTGQVDTDGDGLPDAVDDDIDGDGFANTVEEQVGTDPLDAASVPVDANSNGIPDSLEVYVNACAAGYTNGLQVNNADGFIEFSANAQLFGTSSYELMTPLLTGPNSGSNPTCDGAACYASGSPVAPIASPQFKVSLSGPSYNQSGAFTLGADGVNEFQNITVRANADLTFSPTNAEYIIKNLDLSANATVNFAPGDYWIESFNLSSNTQVFLSGSGLVRLFILNPLTANANAKINSPGNSEGEAGRWRWYL
jgi:hypothetical protein